MATDMDALMEALKRAGSATPGKAIGAKLIKAVPSDELGMSDDDMGGGDDQEPQDEPDDERNEQIVSALETDYPDIYDKITKQIDGGDTSAAPDDTEEAAAPTGM